jgi:HlyD family secretion protein
MSMNSTVLVPTVATTRKWAGWWVLPVVLVLALAFVVARYRPWAKRTGPGVTGQFTTVIPVDMEMKIVKDGELQAIRYIDIENKVEGITQIIWLAKEGTTVEKGEEVVKLDSSNLQLRKENLDLDLRKAESNLKISEEMKLIQEMQNAANKEVAEVSMQLAELAFKQYREGVYPQRLANAQTARDMAQTNLDNKEQDLAQTMTLFARGFVTGTDVKKGELDVINARNELRKADTELKVLQEFSNPMEMARLKSDLAQAEQRVARVLRHNRSLLTQAEADLAEKQAAVKMLRERAQKLQDQLDACVIIAPEAGLVIYMSSIDRSMREPIQEGTNVRYGMTIMRLPDVRAMKAVLKISESQKPRLDENASMRAMVRILGVNRSIGASLTKVAVLPDNSQRWWNPDLKEYPIELTLDETPVGLKPGTRIDAEIFIERLEDVLAVPMSAIYTLGPDSYVFVRDGDHVQHRKVKAGTNNETHVQIISGLNEGEQVMLLQVGQGRQLLEHAGVKLEEPASRPGRERRRAEAQTDATPQASAQ